MVTRRGLLAATAGAGILAALPGSGAHASATGERKWTGSRSANGWSIDPSAVARFRVEGSAATVALRQGTAATVLLHVARRWHYEIAAVDGGNAGGILGHTTSRTVRASFESNHLSGTAIAVHPAAYPANGTERLATHQEAIVRDILLDCAGIVAWGGDLTPAKAGHFHIVVRPGDAALARVAALVRRDTHAPRKSQTAGAVTDPATPARRTRALHLPRPR